MVSLVFKMVSLVFKTVSFVFKMVSPVVKIAVFFSEMISRVFPSRFYITQRLTIGAAAGRLRPRLLPQIFVVLGPSENI